MPAGTNGMLSLLIMNLNNPVTCRHGTSSKDVYVT